MMSKTNNDTKNTLHSMLAFVTDVLVGAVLAFLIGSKIWLATAERQMDALYEDYQQCLTAEDRLTTCMLEYDGDGSTALPSDYHWYWRATPEPQVLSPEEVTKLWEE